MQSSIARAAIVLIACLWPATLRAEGGKALLLDASFSRPLKWTFGGALFLTHDVQSERAVGTVVGGSVGKHGMQVWGGRRAVGFGGGDVRAVVTRTWNDPRAASAHSTYVGGEAGLGGLVWRFSVGYAKRVAGPSTAATISSRRASEWRYRCSLATGRRNVRNLRPRARGTTGTGTSNSVRAAALAPPSTP